METVHHGQFFSTPPRPYFCLGFLFDNSIAYLSDVSFVPESIFALIERKCTLPLRSTLGTSATSADTGTTTLVNGVQAVSVGGQERPRLKALVIDCLRLENHTSHFGLAQAVATARRLGVAKSYLVSHLPVSSSRLRHASVSLLVPNILTLV